MNNLQFCIIKTKKKDTKYNIVVKSIEDTNYILGYLQFTSLGFDYRNKSIVCESYDSVQISPKEIRLSSKGMTADRRDGYLEEEQVKIAYEFINEYEKDKNDE